MFNLKKEEFWSLTLAGLFSVVLVGCGSGSGGDGLPSNDSTSQDDSVDSSPGGDDQVGPENPDESPSFEVLEENNENIEVRSLSVVSEATSENIPDQDRIEVYSVQSPTESDQSFKFEWNIQSPSFVNGEDALVFRKNDKEVRIASFYANGSSSMLSHYASCVIDTAYSLTCEVLGTFDNTGASVEADLYTLRGSEVGEVTVESEFCSLVNGCNRYRIGRIYIH